jgi:hypothetical protein
MTKHDGTAPSALASTSSTQQKILLPGEEGRKPAAKLDYFPHNQYAFVWRNWSVVDKSRLAEVLQTNIKNVEQLIAFGDKLTVSGTSLENKAALFEYYRTDGAVLAMAGGYVVETGYDELVFRSV